MKYRIYSTGLIELYTYAIIISWLKKALWAFIWFDFTWVVNRGCSMDELEKCWYFICLQNRGPSATAPFVLRIFKPTVYQKCIKCHEHTSRTQILTLKLQTVDTQHSHNIFKNCFLLSKQLRSVFPTHWMYLNNQDTYIKACPSTTQPFLVTK